MKVMATVSPLIYGPYYIIAIYALITGKNWIRTWSLAYAWGLFYSLTVIMAEEYMGDSKATAFPIVCLVNMPYWIVVPLLIVYRFWNNSKPFTMKVTENYKKKSN
jgi:hypothetical protein